MRTSTTQDFSAQATLRQSLIFGGLAATGLLAVALLSAPQIANALSMQEADENCRNTVGRAYVESCMGGQKGEGLRDACRAKASPTVRACAQAAMNKAHGRANVAVAIDDGKSKKKEKYRDAEAGYKKAADGILGGAGLRVALGRGRACGDRPIGRAANV